MRILIIGTGYVGLVTGTCLAEMGHTVTCLDINQEKIAQLEQGIVPLYEPGLELLVKKNKKAKRLSFTTSYEKGMQNIDVCFIAVPTPPDEDGSCDLNYVLQAATELAKHLSKYTVVVNKSTVPVGTCSLVKEVIKQELVRLNKKISFDVVSNPEFLKEGAAVNDCMNPDRVIIGSNSEKAIKIIRTIYSPLPINPEQIIVMDPESAELTKYAANAMLATRISFMNELSHLAEKLGANIKQVRLGIGSDPRIGSQFLHAGIGYGGSCFPKDIKALQAMSKKAGCDPTLLKAVEDTNAKQKKLLAKKIINYFQGEQYLKGKVVALWGLAFKPDTDDLREAPSLEIMKELLSYGATLRVFDPVAMDNAKKILPPHSELIYCKDEYECVEGADAIVLVTEWRQFKLADLDRVRSIMKGNAFFDGRNQYETQEMVEKGFTYFGIGVPAGLAPRRELSEIKLSKETLFAYSEL